MVGLVAADHDGHDHGAEDHSTAAEEEGHGDASDLDPHFWQDPLRMAKLGDALAKKLAGLDPDPRFEVGVARHSLGGGRVDAYRRELTPAQVADVEAAIGPALRRWGYAVP